METLKILRLQHGYTQTYVANKLNIRQNTYSQYETGARELPIQALVDLAVLYDVSADFIIGLTSEETPYPRD